MKTAKYKIPAELIPRTKDDGVVLHEGIYVDTIVCRKFYEPADSLCAFCDGGRLVTCAACEGDGEECTTCSETGYTKCPQSEAWWTHE